MCSSQWRIQDFPEEGALAPKGGRQPIITARVRSTREGNIYTWKCLSVHFLGGASQVQVQVGGVPGPGPGRGVPGLRFRGVPGPGPGSGGSQVQVQVVGGYPVSGPGGYPVSVKGKIFDTRFGLIHVQTGK